MGVGHVATLRGWAASGLAGAWGDKVVGRSRRHPARLDGRPV